MTLRCLREAAAVKHHLQRLVVHRVDRVPLNAGLPLALTRFVGEKITFDVAETQKHKGRQTVSFSGRVLC